MVPLHEMLIFAIAALVLVITPGPNMIYLVSRSVTQGRKAGLISLSGVVAGFMIHIILASAGLTALLLAVPLAYYLLKMAGVGYLLYLAYQAVGSGSPNIFEQQNNLQRDKPAKLFSIGFLTNLLNPKVAIFYVSFFPQFIKPEYGTPLIQGLQLGLLHIVICFCVHTIVVLMASRAAVFFAGRPSRIRFQKWFMAGVLARLAVKMALSKTK